MRRYGALTPLAKLRVLLVFLAAQAVVWLFVDGLAVRFSLAVLTAAVLLVLVKTRKPVPR